MNCKRSGRDRREMRRGGVAGSEDNRWGYNYWTHYNGKYIVQLQDYLRPNEDVNLNVQVYN